ncbi:MAG: dTMP kinase [Candidatus Micrarchaeota archaeon]|nr:dTMP kinase [Candidatus Micrarchaeota archaeon]
MALGRARRLRSCKYPTKKAEKAHEHLTGEKDLDAIALANAFVDDIMSEQAKIAREIADGYVVVCDRYLQSTLAYQGVGAGIVSIGRIVEEQGAIVPDLVVLLDIDEKTSLQRKSAQKTPDRFEKDVAFLQRVRTNYLWMARKEFLAYKYVVVDAALPKDEIFSRIITVAEPLLTKRL